MPLRQGGLELIEKLFWMKLPFPQVQRQKVDRNKKKEISGKGLKFPLKNRPEESYKKDSRRYGCKRPNGKRKDRLHAGCDLYAKVGDEVYSVADGIVRKVNPFYAGTWEITVDHGHFMIRYGEVKPKGRPEIIVGYKVKKGTLIGYVGKLEGLNMSMLHLELYGTTATGELTDTNKPPFYRRADLMDPTAFLDELSV